jgi:methionyl-tRNA synthetase
VIARFFRWFNDSSSYFVTGSDEHGQKIAGQAASEGQAPIDICNKYVTGFQVLNQRALISYDDYIRTTSARHKKTAQELWLKCAAADDVYLDEYEGWYNVKEETFVTECR